VKKLTKIKVDTAALTSLNSLLAPQIRILEDVGGVASQVLNDLDMEVASSEGIRQSLSNLHQKSSKEAEILSDLSRTVERVVDSFLSADQTISSQAKELTYLMRQSEVQAGWGSAAAAALSLASIADVNKCFGITMEGYTSIEQAMAAIHSFLDTEAARAGRVSAAGDALYDYLQEHDPLFLFGQYSFAATFINDIKWYEAYGYSFREWKRALVSMFTGKSLEGVAETFMNDPDNCKQLLRGVIDNMCGTEYLDVLNSDQEKFLSIVGDLAEVGGYSDGKDLIEALNGMIGDAETADRILKDYSSNIAMLESIKVMAPGSSVLGKTVDSLILEYKNQAGAMLFDDLRGKVQDGIIDMADYALGLNIGGVDKVIQKVLGDVSSLNALDTVLCTNEMRANAIAAFRNSAQTIMDGNFTASDLTSYQNSFELARALTLEEYKGMLSYYSSGSDEAKYLSHQIEQLETMTCSDFRYATSFSNFKSFSGPSGLGGGGSSGHGF